LTLRQWLGTAGAKQLIRIKESDMDMILTPDAPMPAGHYSQAVEANDFVFVSGMLPTLTKQGGDLDAFDDQVRSALQHCENILASVGCSLDDVVQCTAYIVGVDRWPLFNRIYGERFGSHKPARAVVPVPELHHGALVELQMVAHRLSKRVSAVRNVPLFSDVDKTNI
jgi:2-iminobutanoate/2-iminopropanoate deaminase